MRRIIRADLPAKAIIWLSKQQEQLDNDPKIVVRRRWDDRRPTMNGNGIVKALKAMAGYRERCMYCADSYGSDVEHYQPKGTCRASVFVWMNFLWICQPCNRRKLNKFPSNSAGVPLLLDPSIRDPWDLFVYIGETGDLIPRANLNDLDAEIANATIDPKFTRINLEVVSEGRKKDSRTLVRAGRAYLANPTPANEKDFVEAAADLDHPELVQWFLLHEGADEQPFREIVTAAPCVVGNTLRVLGSLHPAF